MVEQTVDTTISVKSHTNEEEDYSLKNKGKSISLAIQAKVNVQRREGLTLTGGRSLTGQKEHFDVKSNQPMKPSVPKNSHNKSSGQNSFGALRQNNVYQNNSIDKDKLPSKALVTN